MAFTGVAVVQQVSDTKVRITGLSLDADSAGTIGLFGDAGAGVQLPDGFNPKSYSGFGQVVDLAESLEVSLHRAEGTGVGIDGVVITKGGAPFRITLTNPDVENAASEFEIYVTFHE